MFKEWHALVYKQRVKKNQNNENKSEKVNSNELTHV